MKSILLLLAIFTGFGAVAQTETGITIHKDPRLDLLIKKQVELNRKAYLENNRTGSGYRVLVINTNDRSKAMSVKSTLMTNFPEHKTYLIYQSPYFKIQIGNFKERPEADQLKKKILSLYPTGVIVVPAIVELKQDPEDLLN
jgi:hypothetical protein